MMTEAEMRKQLEGLTSEMIGHLYDAFHDLKGGPLHRVALDILWSRHATPATPAMLGPPSPNPWPRHERFVSRGATELSYWVVGYCPKGKPGSPMHGVQRILDWTYPCDQGGKEVQRRFYGVQCDCGDRTDDPHLGFRLYMKYAREDPNSRVWPATVIDGFTHYRVCKFARGIDDVCHAPIADDTMCLCGGYLGANNDDGKSDQLLPSH